MRKKHLAIILALILAINTILPLSAWEAFGTTNSNLTALCSIVQSYTPKDDSFKLSKTSRFFIVSASKPSKDLTDTVKLACSEFAAKKKPSSTPLSIVYGPRSKAKSGDIVIRLIPGDFSKEHYKLNIGKQSVISASDTNGILYGLRTLLKYRIASSSNTLAGALISDYPDVSQRVIHLDCARKYFSQTWIKNFIKKASWQGYNQIEIHFSEDQGLRLESKKYPWLAGSYNDSKGVLTQKQMASICKVAKKYHVEVVPSFDSPGHMNYIVRRYKAYVEKHPDFKFTYKGKTYSRKSKGFKNISNYFKYNGDRSDYNYLGINLSNKVARAFAKSLIDEYADFFKAQGCRKFNIGGDELLGWDTFYLGGRYFGQNDKWYALDHWKSYARNTLGIEKGTAVDAFISYMNDTAKRLENKGYTCRMWSDEIYRKTQHIGLKRSIDVVYWSNNYAPLSKLAKKDFSFYNAISQWTYYVTKPSYRHVNGEDIYNHWNPKNFANPGDSKITVKSSKYLGAYFCIWCDYATINTTRDVWSDLHRKTWSSSVKMWNRHVHSSKSGTGKSLSYSRFKSYTDKIGSFPGYSGSCGHSSNIPDSSALRHV